MNKSIIKLVNEKRQKTIKKLGIHEKEFLFIADCLNGTICNTDMLNCKQSLLYTLEDACEYFQKDQFHEIDFEELGLKLCNFSYEKCLILIYEVELFWDNDFSDYTSDRFRTRRLGLIKSPMEALRDFVLDPDSDTNVSS